MIDGPENPRRPPKKIRCLALRIALWLVTWACRPGAAPSMVGIEERNRALAAINNILRIM